MSFVIIDRIWKSRLNLLVSYDLYVKDNITSYASYQQLVSYELHEVSHVLVSYDSGAVNDIIVQIVTKATDLAQTMLTAWVPI